MKTPPNLYVLVGPSAGGKTSLAADAVAAGHVNKVITTTSRAPRPGEVDGEHYRFVPKQYFREHGHLFVEQSTYADNHYGTQLDDVQSTLALGKPVVLIQDFAGAFATRGVYGTRAVLVGVVPPCREVWERRMSERPAAPASPNATAADVGKDRQLRRETLFREVRMATLQCDATIVTWGREAALLDFLHIMHQRHTLNIVRRSIGALWPEAFERGAVA